MKKKLVVLAVIICSISGMKVWACTSFLVGKNASADGSVMISYAADSHSLYGEMYRWPATG